MSQIDLDAIEARANAASVGPWEVFSSNDDYPPVDFSVITSRYGDEVACFDNHERKSGRHLAATSADAEFIAHARTDVPALLALAREQKAVIERVRVLASSSPNAFLGRSILATLTATEGAQ